MILILTGIIIAGRNHTTVRSMEKHLVSVLDKLVLYLLFKMTKYTFFVATDIIQIVTCK